MSATSLSVQLLMTGMEVFTAAEAASAASDAARTITLAGQDVNKTLDSTTTPKVEVPPVYRKVTISGTTTIDLTAAAGVALPNSATRTLDNTGKKLVGYRFSCPSTNVGSVNVANGAANPYPIFGASKNVDVKPGQTVIGLINGVASAYVAVSATVKNLDITGTAADIVYVELYFGT